MRANTDNTYANRTSAGYLRILTNRCLQSLCAGREDPESKEECMEMLYSRVEAYAEHGYTAYTHSWSSDFLPRHFLLEEIRELAKEIFVECTVTLDTRDILCPSSSSSNPPLLERRYELTISWRNEEENGSYETSTYTTDQ
jgi:hypothetical protein